MFRCKISEFYNNPLPGIRDTASIILTNFASAIAEPSFQKLTKISGYPSCVYSSKRGEMAGVSILNLIHLPFISILNSFLKRMKVGIYLGVSICISF